MPSIRQARVGEMIKRDLAEILQRDMRDPRLALISVTSVEVARDLTIAKVFISSMGTPEEKAAALRALQGAAGFLRGRLGGLLELRSVPQLMFRYDTGIEAGVRMFELLKQEEVNFPEAAKETSEATGEPTVNEASGAEDAAAEDAAAEDAAEDSDAEDDEEDAS